ncbi:transmembrane 4 L6 family member 19 isoform X2 [Erinaceus europaeus]|uniref:Transmembrane 4 L6 family member 19 isoform X2 n=1 Tax=Erinaceus europaeus TaxID=9365 RepID=A0ABM3VV38_ERIEU|nr:transmembrane 4 L6 family member 19 isoform X2 [Erinaceus europaeus]
MPCSQTCSRILGLGLGTTALFAAGANVLLLFPNWEVLAGATLVSLMGWRRGCLSKSGPCRTVLVALVSSGLALLGAVSCFITAGMALKDGPFCMFDVSSFNQTRAWKYGYPFRDLHGRNYLYDRSLWTSVCLEPARAVLWHVALFSCLLCASLVQALLVALHLVNSFLGLLCGLCGRLP